MIHFHGMDKKSSFFEGWYLKQQKGSDTISFIPGYRIDGRGHSSAFVQIITAENSWQVDYPASDFQAATDHMTIRVGKNLFTPLGAHIDIHNGLVQCQGSIGFGQLTPPRYDAMGPFCLIPSLSCNHGVISLFHQLSGSLQLNGEKLSLEGGLGYIEKDWGSSFPKEYLWIHSNDFEGDNCSVMVSIADVPFAGSSFQGCICMIWLKGREYRLATYTGARILACGSRGAVLSQGGLRLEVRLQKGMPQKLLAPEQGRMSRTIHESLSGKAHFRFLKNGEVLLDRMSSHTSYEAVKGSGD